MEGEKCIGGEKGWDEKGGNETKKHVNRCDSLC